MAMTQGPKGDLGRSSGFAEDLVSIDGWRANERMKLAGGSSRCEAAGEVWMDKATCRWQGLQLIRSSVSRTNDMSTTRCVTTSLARHP
jgi:hypothetical protein